VAKRHAGVLLGTLAGAAWKAVTWPLAWLDLGMVWLAMPFGVLVRDPRRRFPILLGVFAVLEILGKLAPPPLSLISLGVAYAGVLAIGRAWVVNEKRRTAIAKKLVDGNPDAMPDLRWTALVAALQLLVIFPLLFHELHRTYELFVVHADATPWDWFWFSIDKTYLKALPDWTVLYNVHITSIDAASPWGRHLLLLSRLTFDYILIQGILRLLAIRTTIQEAVAVVKTDPDMAVRLGRRAVMPLIAKLSDPDPQMRGAAANALTQLSDPRALEPLARALQGLADGKGA
jgi:hypothetical protein